MGAQPVKYLTEVEGGTSASRSKHRSYDSTVQMGTRPWLAAVLTLTPETAPHL